MQLLEHRQEVLTCAPTRRIRERLVKWQALWGKWRKVAPVEKVQTCNISPLPRRGPNGKREANERAFSKQSKRPNDNFRASEEELLEP